MPIWIGSYLADTTHLSRDQHGAYFLMMMAYWRNKGPLQDDPSRLASIVKATRAEWKKLHPILSEFFTVADGMWTHKRIDEELEAAGERSKKAAEKAKAAADARWGVATRTTVSNAPSMPEAFHEDMPGTMLDVCPTPTPLPIGIPTNVVNEINSGGSITREAPVDNSAPPPTPPIPSEFLEYIANTRPDLIPKTVWTVFCERKQPEYRTMGQWMKWVDSEHAPATKNVAANADTALPGVVSTVPSKPGKDPELLRLEQEAQQPRSGPPPELKSKFAELRKARGIPIRGRVA